MARSKRMTRSEKEKLNVPIRRNNTWQDHNGYNSFHLTESQKELANKINSNTLTFVDSVAGTGKTTAVLHTFVKEYVRDPSKQILVIRTPVEAGGLDKVGFLPNELSLKIEPHFASSKRFLNNF